MNGRQRFGVFRVELITVLAEEDKVALIVEGAGAPAFEVRVLMEQRCEHATDAMAQTGVEVVQNHLWLVRAHGGVTL